MPSEAAMECRDRQVPLREGCLQDEILDISLERPVGEGNLEEWVELSLTSSFWCL